MMIDDMVAAERNVDNLIVEAGSQTEAGTRNGISFERERLIFENILLPRIRDELNIQKQSIVASLRDIITRTSCPTAMTMRDIVKNASEPSYSPTILDISKSASDPSVLTSKSRVSFSVDEPSSTNQYPSNRASFKNAFDESFPSQKSASESPEFSGIPRSRSGKRKKELVRAFGLSNPLEDPIHQRKTSTSWIYRKVHSVSFKIFVSLLIIANAVSVGVNTEHEVKAVFAGEDGEKLSWIFSETLFTILFTCELILRILADGRDFFQHSTYLWNLFDTVLVVQAWLSMFLDFIVSKGVPNISFMRVLRILRFFRILRVFRVMRHIRSFRVMLHSLLSSTFSLVCVSLMLLLVIYFFAMVILHGIIAEFDDSQMTEAVHRDLREPFGTVPRAILSLFMSITGGKDWIEIYRPLHALPGIYAGVLVFYVFFTFFGVVNVVTSMFVDDMHRAAKYNHDHVVQCEMDRSRMYLSACEKFFIDADKEGTGKLSWEEFDAYLQKDRGRAYLASLELDELQARALYRLVDVDETNCITLTDFVAGCVQFRGSAKTIDVIILRRMCERIAQAWEDTTELLRRNFAAIDGRLDALDVPVQMI